MAICTRELTYTCQDECGQYGCKGHIAKLKFFSGVTMYKFDIGGKEFYFNHSELTALIDLIISLNRADAVIRVNCFTGEIEGCGSTSSPSLAAGKTEKERFLEEGKITIKEPVILVEIPPSIAKNLNFEKEITISDEVNLSLLESLTEQVKKFEIEFIHLKAAIEYISRRSQIPSSETQNYYYDTAKTNVTKCEDKSSLPDGIIIPEHVKYLEKDHYCSSVTQGEYLHVCDNDNSLNIEYCVSDKTWSLELGNKWYGDTSINYCPYCGFHLSSIYVDKFLSDVKLEFSRINKNQ